jgi:pyridinium-3,5-bisthiocarboxylic acid mononucleotide nickel chelatase
MLYFDCFSGASGDMILGALIDAGVPLEDVRRALGSLAIAPDTVWTDRVTRAGITATKFRVRGEHPPLDHADDHEHGHPHRHADEPHQDAPAGSHRHAPGEAQQHASDESVRGESAHHHVHRTLADISRLIDGSALSGSGKDRAKALFAALGEAEAAIHGTSIEMVHLHEVGAIDSIIDIVGVVFALESLQTDTIVSSPLNVGSGSIRSQHGLYPVPAPATLRLLGDAPIYSGPQRAELVTPTGALLVRSYASRFGTIPAMRVRTVGYGAGSLDFADTPNVLRVLIGEPDGAAPSHSVVVIEAEIDDMNPQIFGVVMDDLLAQGALDVFYTSIQMKKNRPGTLLSVIAPPAARERLTATIFRETTTIGVRYREMARECLDRETVTVVTPLGDVRFKVARRNGEILNASPEFDDCVRLAAEHGRPVKEIQALAASLFLESRSRESAHRPKPNA